MITAAVGSVPVAKPASADEVAQDQGRDRGRRPGFPVRHEPPVRLPHPALDQRAHVLRVQPGLAPGALAHHVLVGRGEQHHRGCGRLSGQPGQHLGPAVRSDPGDGGVGGAEVDTVDGHGGSVATLPGCPSPPCSTWPTRSTTSPGWCPGSPPPWARSPRPAATRPVPTYRCSWSCSRCTTEALGCTGTARSRRERSAFEAIATGLERLLVGRGGEVVAPGAGEPFSAARMEAVGVVPTDDAGRDRTVAELLTPGLAVGDRSVRPARVTVYRHRPS